MIINISQIILVLVVFFAIKLSTFKLTEVWGLPEFLRYEPYVCNKCLSFWTLMGIYLVTGLICHLWITMGVGLLLTVLDTVALIIHQRNNTITIKEYDNDK